MQKSLYERTGRLQRKIDIFRKTLRGPVYVCSTNWHGRCRDAVAMVAATQNLAPTYLFGRFDGRAR